MVADESTNPAWNCFLCPWEMQRATPCDVASVSGELRDATFDSKLRQLELTLRDEHGATVRVRCEEQGRILWRELSAYPPDRWQGLRLTIHHLARTATPETLRLLPAGVIVLEPDLLLNITDINNAEYCVRQYPLRRMIPSPPTAASLRGTVVHRAFEELLKSGDRDIAGHLRRALAAQAPNFALRQIGLAQASVEAEPHLRALAAWHTRQSETLWGAAPRIRAETFLLAPEIGLRGRLDFLLQDDQGG